MCVCVCVCERERERERDREREGCIDMARVNLLNVYKTLVFIPQVPLYHKSYVVYMVYIMNKS